MPEEKLLFSSSLSALISTPKKSTREKRIGNRLPIRAICFSFIFSSVLSSSQGYGFSLLSAGSFGRFASAEPLSCGLLCHSGVFPAIPLFLHSAYVLAVPTGSLSYQKHQKITAVSYTHLDVYKRQTVHSYNIIFSSI